jgi:non-heme chloroperoxidase
VSPAGTPVLFIHGLWLHASSWGPWVERFERAGYAPLAPGWPGESAAIGEVREEPERVAGFGIDDVVQHYTEIARTLGAPPIVIGHSFGGLIAERLLGENVAGGAVAIDAAPMKGILYLPPSALRVASVALRNPANKKRAVALTRKQFRYGFGNALAEAESAELYERWAIPSPGRPLFEAAVANFVPASPAKVATGNTTRGPLLLTAGTKDHTVPPAVVKQALKRYGDSGVTDYEEFPGRGHSLTVDSGWSHVADTVLDWLTRREVGAGSQKESLQSG